MSSSMLVLPRRHSSSAARRVAVFEWSSRVSRIQSVPGRADFSKSAFLLKERISVESPSSEDGLASQTKSFNQHQKDRSGQMSVISGTALAFVGGIAVGALCKYVVKKRLGSNESQELVHDIDNTPISNSWQNPVEANEKIRPGLGLVEASAKLRACEQTKVHATKEPAGVQRLDTIQLASNSPVEDTYAHTTVDVGLEKPWNFWGVYDGHGGWATSFLLRSSLIARVAKQLELNSQNQTKPVDETIKSAFLQLDSEIISIGLDAVNNTTLPHAEAHSRVAMAQAGSCALLALHDPATSRVWVACVGDSRAVLCRRTAQEKDGPQSWSAIPLSADQTGFNEDEKERVASEHPGEDAIIDPKTGRLLGIMVTRGFGDARWKWPTEALEDAVVKFVGRPPRPNYKTPPYMTAEPVVTTTNIEPGDVLILASDGFWDRMSNKNTSACLEMWIQEKSKRNKLASINDLPESIKLHSTSPVPVELGRIDEYNMSPEHFVVEDENCATHLVRNALGGKKRELFCSVMSVQPPESRDIRDDITVQVVFFGDVFGAQ